MHFLKRSASFSRFRVLGKFAFSQEEFSKNFQMNAFRDFSKLSDEQEESIGWVSPENCLEAPELDTIMVEPYFKLMMRIDRKKISKVLMSAHMAIEERAALEVSGKKKLSRSERQLIKSSVKEIALKKASVTSNLYRGLWNFRTCTCLVFSTSKNVCHHFCKLFQETFDLDLEPLDAWGLAEEWAQERNAMKALESIEPSSFKVRRKTT